VIVNAIKKILEDKQGELHLYITALVNQQISQFVDRMLSAENEQLKALVSKVVEEIKKREKSND
jgi:hypothetical protein